MLRRAEHELGDLSSQGSERSLEFSNDIRRPRRPFAVPVSIALASLVLTCAVGPWLWVLRGSSPELEAGASRATEERGAKRPAAPELPATPLAETPAQAAAPSLPAPLADAAPVPIVVPGFDPPAMARAPQPSVAPSAGEPDRARLERPEDVTPAPAETAPGVAANETRPVRSLTPAPERQVLPLAQAALVPPVEAPTLGPERVAIARASALARRLPAMPKPQPPLPPSRIPVDPAAPDRTASITGLPKPPPTSSRARVDTGAVVRASTRKPQAPPAARPQSPGAPAAAWRLPPALAPTD